MFLATSKDLPDLLAQGRTIAETVESYLEHGDELPSAVRTTPGNRLELRIPVNVE